MNSRPVLLLYLSECYLENFSLVLVRGQYNLGQKSVKAGAEGISVCGKLLRQQSSPFQKKKKVQPMEDSLPNYSYGCWLLSVSHCLVLSLFTFKFFWHSLCLPSEWVIKERERKTEYSSWKLQSFHNLLLRINTYYCYNMLFIRSESSPHSRGR